MKEVSAKTNKKGMKKLAIGIGSAITLIVVAVVLVITGILERRKEYQSDPEIARTMQYEPVNEGEAAVEGTDYVKFDAFFLRNLNGNKYADGIRGMCRKIGQQDTLYMEINVLDNGYFKDGKITINNENFELQTAIVKDKEVASNYISNNTKEIQFNNLQNGTQKLVMGIVRAGKLISENDTSKYSKVNSVTLTGTHVADDGTETNVTKTVPFTIDWHGTTSTAIYANVKNKSTIEETKIKDLKTLLTSRGLELSINIAPSEITNELILKKSYIEGTMPKLNGYLPKAIEIPGVKYTYDEATGKFVIAKESEVSGTKLTKTVTAYNEGGIRYNRYTLNAIYPQEAYDGDITNSIQLRIPVKAYHEGYNNTNSEFQNPYKSNEAQTTIVKTWKKVTGKVYDFNIVVGEFIPGNVALGEKWAYGISKEKPYRIYNGLSEKEDADTYEVRWYVTVNEDIDKIIMKEFDNTADVFITKGNTEESMEQLTKNIGVYFSNPLRLLGEEGWIKVYNNETNALIETFTKENWSKYNKQSPYYYEEAIKHIRIETSKGHSGGELNVYHVKELDDTYITSHYTKEKFDNLEHIQSHLHGMVQDSTIGNGEVHYIQTGVYKAPTSMAEIKMENPKMATQEASDRKIVISTKSTTIVEQQWKNGSFLVKLPSNIIQAKVNSIATNTTKVKIIGYDLYKDAGNYYIKVLTENEEEATYNIVIDCNLTPDPIGLTETKPIELYASNEIGIYYQNSAADQYDVNNNLNTKENVNYSITNISFIAPTSLITSQTGSEFDNKGSIVRAPQIAEITKAQRTAKINVQIANNYGSTVSEMLVLGKIPFAGNRTTLTNQELGSTYTATMNNTGIQVPAELARYATVYYSENENPTKDLQDSNNGWKTKNEVTNWNNIKTYLIDFGNYVMAKGTTHTFIYEIHVPEGLEYGNVAYSTHVVYFSLDTEHGKYRTQTEPNKLGFIVDKKFDLEITKYQENTEKLLPKVTYMITEEGTENSKIKTTDENGKISIAGLYVGRIYHIKEIKTPSDYELKEEVVKFRTTADEEDNVHVEILEGNIRASETVKEESWKVKVALDNTVKAKLKINKKDETGVPLGNIKFKINGKGNDNVFIRTGANGEVSLQGICLNEEYTLEEVQADGYYFIDRISFKITNQEGEFVLEILSGNVEQEEITIENEIPTINFEIQNERIPTYDLEIVKVKKNSETEKIKGVQFKLEGERIEKPQYYFTDENGKITIPELYQYVEGKNLEAKYTLTEVFAPEGYVTDTTPIVFKVQEIDGNLQLQQESGTIKTNVVDGNKVTLTIENSPIFNLTKYTEEGREKVNLPNAKFMIYTLDENRNVIEQAKDTKGNIIDTVSTDAQGEISIDLPQGIYKVIETEAPEGYQLPEKEEDRTYYFGVGASLPVKTELKKTNENSYGGPKDEKVVSIEATNDRGYIIGGQRYDGGPKGILIKYDNKGNVQWDKEISETYNNSVKYIMSARNGDYIVSGWFRSDTLNLGNNVTITKNTSESECYMLIRYNSKGIAIWAKAIGDKSITRMAESSDGKIFAIDSNNTISKFSDTGDLVWEKQIQRSSNIIGTSDKGVVVGGYFSVDSITIDNKITLTKQGNQDAFIVKFDENGTIKWTKQFGESGKVATLGVFSETKDRNIIIGIKGLGKIIKCDNNNGEIYWTEQEPEKGISYITDNGYLGVKNSAGCRIVKYDNNMNIEWEKYLSVDALIGSESFQKISDREFVLVITYGGYKDYIQVDKGNRFISNGGKDIATFKLEEVETAPQIPEMQSIEVENTRKQYNITTEIAPNEAGQRVGGTVTGIYNETYPEANNKKYIETVSHGKNATQNIEITPNTGYVVKEVTLNGQKVNFVPDTEGKVILPALENVTEDKHYVIVFDNTIGQILVHHYIDGTTTKVAEDETSQGTIGESYTTSPKVDLAQYELKKLEDGEYQIPENATGTYKSELQEIIYYYVKKQIPLTVHHYIEGTTQSVPLKDGSIAQDEQRLGQENEEYTTNAKSAEELDSKYELVEMPENANGVYTYDEVIVTYYYKLKTVNITTRVEKHIETNELGEEVEVAGGSITGEGQTPYETVVYTENSVKDIIATPEEGYKVAKIAVNGEEIEFTANEDKTVTLDKFINMTEDKEVVVEFERIPARLIVHHYIEGTTTKVPSRVTGEAVQDEERQGEIGDIYATQKSDKVADNYLCLNETPEKAQGILTEELIEVIYYYVLNAGETESTIEKTGTEKITLSTAPVSYRVNYNATIKDYIGEATLTIVDTLPYKIDTEAEALELNGGEYNEEEQTITWEVPLGHINTFENGDKTVTLTKEITVVYKDLDKTADSMANHVKGTITFAELETKDEKEDETDTLIDIKGKVIVKYVDEETGEEIKYTNEEGQETTYGYGFEQKVGTDYTTEKKEIAKYEYVRDSQNTAGKVKEGTTEVIYYYRLKKVNITTRVEKHIETNEQGEEIQVAGGSITGEGQTPYETVVYTENSVKDIIATPEEGYKVSKITVNGEEIEFTANEDKTVTLDKFINMTENKEVVVEFERIPAKVIVHHYIEGTTIKVPSKTDGQVVQDEEKQGYVGKNYTTTKSPDAAPNYECVEEVPEKAQGTMTEESIEVIYYYRLKNETVETEITKTATASKTVQKEENGKIKNVAVLTREDGEVSYTISHRVKITDYIGKAKIKLVDTLPAKIDLSKSDLAEGSYDEATNTITWEETIENIDTYTTNGEFNKTITKNIKVVYVDQDVTKVLVNKATGSVTTYYPESYTPKPGEEKETVTKETEEKVEQEYKVDKTVEKIWEDNENSKGKRPQGIKVQLTGNGANEVEGTVLEQVILSEENSWSHTYTNLPKYDSEGQIIAYTAQESEVNAKDLEYYNEAQVAVERDKITITNPYKESNTTTESTIEKTGTEKITLSTAPVTYNINYNATIKDYIGEATVTIVDTLPYKIDTEAEALELNGGVYNEEAQTITWIENLGHINTFENGDRVVNLSKEITVVYKDIDKTLESMTNHVKGIVTFSELETKDEKEDETDTLIDIKGKVVVKYVDEETGEEIKYTNEEGQETTHGYEYEDKVGTDYGTNKKEIEGYEYVRVEGSETGKIEEGTTEVTYYYRRKRVKVVTMVQKHQETTEDGSIVEVAGGTITGEGEEAYEVVKYGDDSTKDIIATPEEGYRVSKITVNGEEIGFIEKADRTVEISKFKHMTEDKVVIVEFERIPAKVIVHHYIEGTTTKVPSRTDGQVQDEEKEGYVGKAYTTTKSLEVSPNYECVNETPEKASGTMTEKTIEVIYYYRLKDETVETEVSKTATASKIVDGVVVLTREDGEVNYTISHRVKIKDYIGKAKIKLVDTLPAKIDLSKSDLGEGNYDEEANTITWEMTIEGIDTFANGIFDETITKNIRLVYVDQDVTKALVNKATGSVTTYYPESYTPKPGEEKETVTKETEEKVEQEYKVDKTVEKIWEDNENSKGKRPQGVKIQLTGNGANEVEGTVLEQVILSEENRWSYTFVNLPKYDSKGKEIKYSVKESEVNNKDLEYYEKAQVTTSGNKIIVTNEYKLVETELDSNITKTATEKITASNMPVTYIVNYNATIKDYIGEAILTITDTLPYQIDSVASELNGGVYNEDLQTITWTENLGHINTFEIGNKEINIEKQIVVVYTNLDASKEKMTNHVKGKLEFTQNDTKNEVEDDADTLIEIKGQVIVKYVDIETNEEIAPGGQKEDKVGTTYGTIQKDIEHYEFVKVTGEPEGEIKEGITEVIYYHKKIPKGKVVVKYVDEEGNEIAPGGQKEDYVGEEYKTKQKDIENYEFVEVTGEPEGEIKEGITEVIYHYKKIKTDLVVRYLEKGTNKPLLEEEHKEGYVGDSYTTTRKEVTNYKPASPEPENAKGKLVKGTTYVTYYYEKIQPGKVIVKYVDIETKEELIDKGENKPYGYEKEDEVGEKYTTEEKNIPYYEYVKEQEPENKNGTIKEGSTTVIYYYRKLPFNIGVDKTIKEIRVNGEKLGNKQGKDLLKVEVVGSKINETEVVVTYSIVVRNTGKIDGTAELLERIPKGYTIEEKTSKEWKKTKDGNLTANINLKAGEEKELEVVLRWKNGNSNLGQMSNTVEITKTSNPAGYKETTIEDNKSEADVLMSVKTGVGKNVIATVLVAVIAVGMLGAYHTILIKDLKKKEK